MTDINALPILADADIADDDWTIIFDLSDGVLKRIKKSGLTADQVANIDAVSQWAGGNKTVENNLTIGENFRVNGTTELIGALTAAAAILSGNLRTQGTFRSDGDAQFDGDISVGGDLNLTDPRQLQSDWDEDDDTEEGYIRNKPFVVGFAGLDVSDGTKTVTMFQGDGGDSRSVKRAETIKDYAQSGAYKLYCIYTGAEK